MVESFILGLMVIAMKVIFILMKLIVKAFTLMGVSMKINCLIVNNMVKAFILRLMVIAMKVNLRMIKNMVAFPLMN